MSKIKKAIVTGGSGFIGHHLVKALLNQGTEVGITSRYGNIVKNDRLRSVWDKLMVFEADLRHRDSLSRMMHWRPDVVFHLAAYNQVLGSFSQVEEVYQVNALGSANVMDVVDGNAKVVYISSSEVYGHQEHIPWHESMVPQPQSPYAITKYAGELHAIMLQRMGHPIQILRPFNTYGPYQSTRAVIPELIMKALNGVPLNTTFGEQTREFNYVSDIVAGMILAAEHDEVIPGPVNLASGSEVTVADLVNSINTLCGSKSKWNRGSIPYRPNEIWRMKADASKAFEKFGWTPKVSFQQGLAGTVEWFKENGAACV